MPELDWNHPTTNSPEPSAVEDKQLEADFIAVICEQLIPKD